MDSFNCSMCGNVCISVAFPFTLSFLKNVDRQHDGTVIYTVATEQKKKIQSRGI